MDSLRALRMFNATLCITFAGALAAPSAALADDDEDKPKKKLIVTVEDNDVVAAEEEAAAREDVEEEPAPKKKKKKRVDADAPDLNSSEAEIDAYLRELDRDVRDTAADLKAAKRSDDGDEVMRLESELRYRKALLSDEKDRLTETNPGLVAGGAVLTGLGGVSLVSSLVLLVVWPLTGVDGHFDDEYGYGALGCLIGGTVGLSAGIPMIVSGARRTPRGDGGYDDAFLMPPQGPRVGVTFGVPF